jgi:hypothetical protein
MRRQLRQHRHDGRRSQLLRRTRTTISGAPARARAGWGTVLSSESGPQRRQRCIATSISGRARWSWPHPPGGLDWEPGGVEGLYLQTLSLYIMSTLFICGRRGMQMATPDAPGPAPDRPVPALMRWYRRLLSSTWFWFWVGEAPLFLVNTISSAFRTRLPPTWIRVGLLVALFWMALVWFLLALRWLRTTPPTPRWAYLVSIGSLCLMAASACMGLWLALVQDDSVPALDNSLAAVAAIAGVTGLSLGIVSLSVQYYAPFKQAIHDGWDPPLPPDAD